MVDGKLKKNIVLNALTQLVVVLVPLIAAPFVSRRLNAELIGVYNYCYSIVSIFALFANVGLSNTGIALVAKVKDDKAKLSSVFWSLMLLRLIFTLGTVAVYAVFVILSKEYSSYFWIFLLFIIGTFLDVTWFFQGLENFKIVFMRTVLVRILLLVLILVFVRAPEDFPLYVWANVLSIFLPSVLVFPALFKYLQKVPLSDIHPFENFRVILEFFLPGVAYTLYAMIDKTMIKLITGGTVEVGYYEQAYKIAFIGITAMTVFGTVFSSRISGIKDDEEIKGLHTSYLCLALSVSLVMLVGLFSLADFFIPFFYGPGYTGSINILKLFSLLPLIMGISNFVSYLYFIPKLISRPPLIIIIIAILLNAGLNALFIKFMGGFGAALATVISETFISVSYLCFYRKYSPLMPLVRKLWKYFVAFGIDFGATFLLCYFVPCTEVWQFFVYAPAIVLLYAVLLLAFREEKAYAALRWAAAKLKRKK